MSFVDAFFDSIARAFGPLWAPIDARLNPILVKEVRQSLRGRYFSIAFWFMVVLATAIGCVLLVRQGFDPDDDGGRTFFLAMYGCLSVAVHVFVPFSAFLSVGSEWEENTYDLLVLSNMRPFQIVLGKLTAAVVQILLFYCAFGPFLVFAFLLRGLDLVAAGWVLGLTFVTSVGLSCVALGMSSLIRHRFARVLLMALQAAMLIGACTGSIAASTALLTEGIVRAREFKLAAGTFATFATVVAAFACAFAATRFTHPEENRSTGLRVLTTAVVLAAIGWTAYLFHVVRETGLVEAFSTATLVGLSLMSLIFCAEPERLGRRVRMQVPRTRLAALLLAPYFPGGGRAVLFFFLHAALIGCAILTIPVVITHSGTVDPKIPIVMLLYTTVYILVPTSVMAPFSRALKWRVLARCLVPLTMFAGIILPSVVGFLLGMEEVARGNHIGNLVWTAEEWEGSNSRPVSGVAMIALGAVALSLYRVVGALRESARCSRERAEREARVDARA